MIIQKKDGVAWNMCLYDLKFKNYRLKYSFHFHSKLLGKANVFVNWGQH